MATRWIPVLAALAGLGLWACGGDDGGGGHGGTARCTAGARTDCTCDDGAAGTKLCADDRTWGDCDCAAEPADALTPDTLQPDVPEAPPCVPDCADKQ